MLKRSLALGLFALAMTGEAARAEVLRMGSPAPKLEVKEFVKGQPLKTLEKGKIHVVEFWATWCGPCIQTIPHLTKLQKKYPQVTVIGVSVWEDTPADVKPFVAKMGAKMGYRVATDLVPAGKSANAGKMSMAWMKAAGKSSIPTAFIVDREGKIAWLGHPGNMDEPLAKVMAGKWNIQAEAAAMRKNESPQEKLARLDLEIEEARGKGNFRQVIAVVDQAIREDRRFEPALAMPRFQAMRELKDPAALEYGRKLINGTYKEHAKGLDAIAWSLVDPKRSRPPAPYAKLALEAAKKADSIANQRDPSIADTLARAMFLNGDAKGAARVQERSLMLCKGTVMEKQPEFKAMKARLQEYRRAAR